MIDHCIPDCPLCDGCGFVMEDHGSDCKCLGHDVDNPRWDPRHAMVPCPNKPYLVIDPADPRDVEYAERHGFTKEVSA